MADLRIKSIFQAIDKLTGPVKKMGNSVSSFSKKFQKNLLLANEGQARFNKTLTKGAAILAGVVAVNKLGTAITGVVRAGAELDKTLRSAVVRFPGQIRPGQQAFEKIKATVRGLGEETEFTSVQVGKGLEFMALAGFSADQALKSLPLTLEFATSSQIDLGLATDIATDSLGAFGLATKNSAKLTKNLSRIMDVYSKTASSSNATTEQLFETFVEAGPVATGLGVSLETVAALAGKLANSGLKASRSGTILKNVLLALSAPANQKFFKQLGISTQDAGGNLRDALDILEDVQKSLSKFGSAQRSAAIDTIFTKRAVAGMNVIFKLGVDKVRKYRDELKRAGGTSKEIADVMRAGISVRLAKISSAFESVRLDLFEAALPIIESVADRLIDAARASSLWLKANKDLVTNGLNKVLDVSSLIFGVIGGVSSAMLALAQNPIIQLVAGLFILRKALIAIRIVMLLVNVAFAANPISVVVISVVALVLALANLGKIWKKIKSIGGQIGRVLGFGKEPVANQGTQQAASIGTPPPLLSTANNGQPNRSVLDVNFSNVPDNVDVSQRGNLPGLNLNLGRTF